MTEINDIAKGIEKLIPKNLDEIITINRDRFSMQLADAHHLAKLPSMIEALNQDIRVKAVINSYWIVEVIDVLHGSEFFLLGYKRSAFISSNMR
jgi:hypothetical protein